MPTLKDTLRTALEQLTATRSMPDSSMSEAQAKLDSLIASLQDAIAMLESQLG